MNLGTNSTHIPLSVIARSGISFWTTITHQLFSMRQIKYIRNTTVNNIIDSENKFVKTYQLWYFMGALFLKKLFWDDFYETFQTIE